MVKAQKLTLYRVKGIYFTIEEEVTWELNKKEAKVTRIQCDFIYFY